VRRTSYATRSNVYSFSRGKALGIGSRIVSNIWVMSGPDLFTVHGKVTWTFIDSLLVGKVLMMLLGVLKYLASRVGFSAAPLVLGLIVGRLTETSFLHGRTLAGDATWSYFLGGPTDKIVIALCVLSIAYSIYGEREHIRR